MCTKGGMRCEVGPAALCKPGMSVTHFERPSAVIHAGQA